MEFFGGDRWEEEEEMEYNDIPPKGIDEAFAKNVLKIKHDLYDGTVLSTDIEDVKSQDNQLLLDYLKHMNRVYVLAVISQNGKKNAYQLDEFPKEARESIQRTLEWLETFFSTNQIPDTIPYTHYIRNQFHVYPFIQDNSFIEEK